MQISSVVLIIKFLLTFRANGNVWGYEDFSFFFFAFYDLELFFGVCFRFNFMNTILTRFHILHIQFQNKEQKKEQDILFKEEDDWITYIKENEYDIIIADPLLKKAVPFYKGEWYDLPHFAISGKKRQSV